MIEFDKLDRLFWSDQAADRLVGYGSNVSIARDNRAAAISICAQLLHRSDKTPSGKWLWLQLQPGDALVLAASILAHAMEKGWPIAPDFLEQIERIRLSPDAERH
jgi:hypothetical protein